VGAVRIGFLCETTNNAYYRAIIPMRAIEQRGHTVVWPDRLGEDTPLSRLLGCDHVHVYRRPERLADMQALRKHGVSVSFDNDDDFASALVSDGGTGLEGYRYNRKIARSLLDAARTASLVTTPSHVLAEGYLKAGVSRVRVIENRLERGMSGFGSKGAHDGVVIGWVAGREHSADLDRLEVKDALECALREHTWLQVLTVGLRLSIRSERYRHIASVPFPKLLQAIGEMDVGIAPLADVPFNRARSNVKLKEYASARVPWLASPVGPYCELGEEHGGMLVDDDGWHRAIDELARDVRRRRRLRRRAYRWAKRETIDRHAQAWESAFEAAAGAE
jgi:glycosyltransferase involved in cell wall biosynthesis